MKKARSTEEAPAAVRTIREAPAGRDLKLDLAPFLRHKSNHVIAAAAAVIERLEAVELAPELSDAFLELMQDPARRDPGCHATIAIAKALAALDQPAAKAYFLGIRHVQKEGSFGPPQDVAAPLRGLCAQGLARMSHPEALQECVRLLADPEVAARAGAVRAIADAGRPEGALLLRLKALLGDKDEEILGDCFSALLRLAPADSLEFVAEFLASSAEDVSQRAALALGESRQAAAFPLLRQAWEQTARAALRRTILLAMAMLRHDEALEFLLSQLGGDSERASVDALAALSLYERDATVERRVQKILAARKAQR